MSTRTRPWTAGTPCWVDLGTPDPDGARDVYGALLGWQHEIGGEEHGGCTVCSVGGTAAAGLVRTLGPEQPSAWTLYFATDDAAVATVQRLGGSARPVDDTPHGRMTTVTDPWGAVFAIVETGAPEQPDRS